MATYPERHPADLTVLEAATALRSGRLSAEEFAAACLTRIRQRDPAFGAWISVYEDRALEMAREADRKLRAGDGGPLTGIPIGLKDVIGVEGLPLTADSPVLAGNRATVDATAWSRLHAAGAVLLGHLHCGEFACGTWGVNPWDRQFSAGGSSSGSGIAVAARTVPATLGTDGRGSIRMPAGMTGVTGLKPTFGLVSTSGCIPITFSYDVVGPMARAAADCALLMAALVGPDPLDRVTLAQPTPLTFPIEPHAGAHPLAGVRIGVSRFAPGALSDGVAAVFDRFQDELGRLGAVLISIDRPANPLEENDGLGPGWKTVLGAEALAIHAQFAGREHLHREDFLVLFEPMTQEVGTAVDYVRAQMKRAELVATWEAIFVEHDLQAVIEPGLASEIWKVNEQGQLMIDEERPALFGMWNDTNFPALSVPVGLSPADGGPVGIQVIGLPYSDPRLLQLAIDYQASTDHHTQEPPGLHEPDLQPYEPPPVPNEGPQPSYVAPPSPFDVVIPRPHAAARPTNPSTSS